METVTNSHPLGESGAESVKQTASSKILVAARELFYRRGIRAVGVDEIIYKACVTKASLYRVFKSKDSLVAACLHESAREGRQAIQSALDTAGTDPRKRLDALLRYYANRLQLPNFRGCQISNVAVELPEPDHPGRAVIIDSKSEIRAVFVQTASDLPVSNPETLADSLILVIEGAISTHHILGCQGPAQSMMATCELLVESHLERKLPKG